MIVTISIPAGTRGASREFHVPRLWVSLKTWGRPSLLPLHRDGIGKRIAEASGGLQIARVKINARQIPCSPTFNVHFAYRIMSMRNDVESRLSKDLMTPPN